MCDLVRVNHTRSRTAQAVAWCVDTIATCVVNHFDKNAVTTPMLRSRSPTR